jgi:hypothetical protein
MRIVAVLAVGEGFGLREQVREQRAVAFAMRVIGLHVPTKSPG